MIGYDTFVAVRFKAKDLSENPQHLPLLHAVVGVSGEAGELLDAVKKAWVYGKSLDRANVIEELGDIEFYLEAARAELGVSRDEVILANREKLLKRYPTGYTDQLAIERKDKASEDSERALTPAGDLAAHVHPDKAAESLFSKLAEEQIQSYGGTL